MNHAYRWNFDTLNLKNVKIWKFGDLVFTWKFEDLELRNLEIRNVESGNLCETLHLRKLNTLKSTIMKSGHMFGSLLGNIVIWELNNSLIDQ